MLAATGCSTRSGIAAPGESSTAGTSSPTINVAVKSTDAVCVLSDAEASKLLDQPIGRRVGGTNECYYYADPERDAQGSLVMVTVVSMPAPPGHDYRAECHDFGYTDHDRFLPLGDCAIARAPLMRGGSLDGIVFADGNAYGVSVTGSTAQNEKDEQGRLVTALTLAAKRFGVTGR
jgi:hypothetical protein